MPILSFTSFFIAVDSESESASLEPKIGKEVTDYKEVKRVDHILAALQRKVTPVTSCNVLVVNAYSSSYKLV